MNKTAKWIIGIIVIILVVWLGYFYYKKPVNNEPIKIGVSMPLTGPVALLGEWTLDGMNLAKEEINASGGINGHFIELTVEDDKCNAQEGTNTVNKLLKADNVKAMVIYCGAVSGAVAPIIDGKSLAMNISIRTEDLEGKYPFLVSLSPAPEKEVGVIIQYLLKNNIKRVAVINQADFYGQTYRDKFKSAFEKAGGTVILESQTENLSTPDFRTDLIKAKAVGAEAIYTTFNAPQYIVLLKQANELKINLRFFSNWGTESSLLVKDAGSLAENIIYTYFFQGRDDSVYKSFSDIYMSKYQQGPEANAANGYDSIKIISSVYGECDGDVNCMVEKINQIKNYDGASGIISFSGSVANKEIFLKTIKNGQFVKYEE